MEEILASIRRIISDEETTPEGEAAAGEDDMAAAMAGDSTEMSQDDLDKLFDSDGDADIDEPVAVAAEDDAEDDVLELTEDLAVEESEQVDDFDMVDGLDVEGDTVGDVAFVDEPDEVAAAAAPAPKAEPAKAEAPQMSGAAEELLSPATNEAVHNAFNNLAGTILTNNARTLEDLVKDMLRPMLKSWLDDNLPSLVERLVRQEIERVSRGR
ncbi:hypothetical protein GCM10007285_05210 [Stappia taiwanensis]|nr:hypothetical protein GCM10007285_05210 [Stappia taiwanensis]